MRLKLLCVLVVVLAVVPGAFADTIGYLEQVSPTPTTYTRGIDFVSFINGALGNVTAPVYDVGNLGCGAGDFAGMPAGYIAMVNRGTCFFSQKTNLADFFGAVGILIVNNNPIMPLDNGVQMANPTFIPALLISQQLGADLRNILRSGELTVKMQVTPEPGTLALLGTGLLGIWRRRKKT